MLLRQPAVAQVVDLALSIGSPTPRGTAFAGIRARQQHRHGASRAQEKDAARRRLQGNAQAPLLREALGEGRAGEDRRGASHAQSRTKAGDPRGADHSQTQAGRQTTGTGVRFFRPFANSRPAGGGQSQMIEFPNHSRSYDPTRRAVRFWGHDNVIEASFFISDGALRHLAPDVRIDEPGFLEAFDSNRDLIYAAAAKVYVRGGKGSYELE